MALLIRGDAMKRLRRLLAVVSLGCLCAPVAGAFAVRVVSQTVGADELLLALAAPEQVAALSEFSHEPGYSAVADQARRYPRLAQGDAETILKFAPTLVLAADYTRAELIVHLRRAGVRVLVFDRYQTLADAFADLRRLASELGPEAAARAERIIAAGGRRMRVLEEKLRGVRPVRVIAPSTYGAIPGAETTFQDLCDHAGAANLAATLGRLRGHEPPPAEQMLTWPVDRVVLGGADAASALAPFRRLPPYEHMPAIREARVVLIEPWMLSCVTHHRIDAYERMARALHPEVFR